MATAVFKNRTKIINTSKVIISPLKYFWKFSNSTGKLLNNFNVVYSSGTLNVNWGDGTIENISSNTNTSHTFQEYSVVNRIILTPSQGFDKITDINCGTSSPKLSGSINLSLFPNITDFTCTNNDITKIIGYENNPNLINIDFSRNKITGSIPNLNNNTHLRKFYCLVNQLTGSIPTLSSNTQLRDFRCHLNQLTGTIPAINKNYFLVEFNCSLNQLTGQIPSPLHLLNFTNYYCYNNQLTGQIPTLNNNIQRFDCGNNQLTGQIPNLNKLGILRVFVCRSNQISGTIPSLSNNNQLDEFQCQANLLTDSAGGSVSNTLGNFQAQNNQLPSTAVNAILAAFVAANRTSGTRILNLGGTGNAAPTGQGLTDKATLISRGWTVTTN